MKVQVTIAGKVYEGEVVEEAIRGLVEQGIRYKLLNSTGKVPRSELFENLRQGKTTDAAATLRDENARLKAELATLKGK